ncbi:hypothetical protein [Methanolobus sp. ZRKC5]|uniref:hypothetical protein n=1 Tax=unclassified Methanolobus TaxID=2629569 RepID=UPI00313E351D
MKFGPLEDVAKSLAHALQNKAGGRSGLFFQIYSFLWIVLSTYLIASLILSINSKLDLIYAASAPIYIFLLYIIIYIFWTYEKRVGIESRRVKELQIVDSVNLEYKFTEPAELGFSNMLFFRVNNPTEKMIENIWIRAAFPGTIRCDKPVLNLGDIEPISSVSSSFSFIPLVAGTMSMGYCDLYLEVNNNKHQKHPIFFGNIDIVHSFFELKFEQLETLRLGQSSTISIKMKNTLNVDLINLHVKSSFPKGLKYDTAFSDTKNMAPDSSYGVTYQIMPTIAGILDIGYFEIIFTLGNNNCKIGPVAFGEQHIQIPDVNVKINVPETLYSEVGNTLNIYVENRSDETVSNVCFNSCFSSFVECQNTDACIPEIQPHSSAYTSLAIKPINAGKIDLGNLNFSFEVNEVLCQQEPIDLGTHEIA